MSRYSSAKEIRQNSLSESLKKNPFLTDEELSEMFHVSIPTIRLDRLKLGIPELRERVRTVAQQNYSKIKSIKVSEMIGEVLEINLGQNGISILETYASMAFKKTKIIQGRYIYSLAESLAIAVIDAQVALVGIANIKYNVPCYAGSKLFAKAEVKKVRGNKYIVWVKIFERQTEVFKGKFILVSIEEAPAK